MADQGQVDPGAVMETNAAPGKAPAEGTQNNMSPHQIAQHLTGAGMRRPRLSIEHEDAQDAPPPKPLTREILSGQAVEPKDQNMVEALVSSTGAQNRSEILAKSYATAAGASASKEGKAPQPEKK
eukprot:3079548-Prymnesium_polylepis.1